MSYPMHTNPRDAWQYKQVKNLLGGLNTDAPKDAIDDTQTITLRNLRASFGDLRSDTGYTPFGQVVVGAPHATYQFDRRVLSSELILITLSTLYKWDTTFLRWRLVRGLANTTSTSAYAAGTTSIVVAAGAGFTTGALIGIILDNGDQHQTTVTVSGTTFTLANPVPVGRSILNGAIIECAVVLTGSLDKQVSIVTMAGNDWLIFTNGVNIVQYYDGTSCQAVPNLPSGGSIVCMSVVVYNNALFLFSTIESGVIHSQRIRRSDQTDPTNWTTGTSGFDDLLDTPDTIVTREILGPYLIVYKDRSIYRGSFVGSSGLNYVWECMVTSEGAISMGSTIDMGDYHIFVGHANVYEYRGDYNLSPIGDNIYSMIFSHKGDLNPAFQQRLFALYVEELDEVWISYVSTTSTDDACDTTLRYNVKNKFWYTRTFHDSIIGYGFYAKVTSILWNSLVGSWAAQTWAWNTKQNISGAPVTQLCSSITNQVYSYDYTAALDNVSQIAYTVETKDFAVPDAETRFDMIEMFIQGTDVNLEYSTDGGVSWSFLAKITQPVQNKVRVHTQFVFHRVMFRWSGTSNDFMLEWFGFSYKTESLY